MCSFTFRWSLIYSPLFDLQPSELLSVVRSFPQTVTRLITVTVIVGSVQVAQTWGGYLVHGRV